MAALMVDMRVAALSLFYFWKYLETQLFPILFPRFCFAMKK